MYTDPLSDYRQRILPNIEHPIREIINALWQLPFVVDTNEACSGHIVTNDWTKSKSVSIDIGYPGVFWYPHGIRLGIDFSQEIELRKNAEAFRHDIATIQTDIGLLVSGHERNYNTRDNRRITVLHVFYSSVYPSRDLKPPLDDIAVSISNAQNRLVHFWEAFAIILKKYNPSVGISSIKDKDFSSVINWMDLGDSRRYK